MYYSLIIIKVILLNIGINFFAWIGAWSKNEPSIKISNSQPKEQSIIQKFDSLHYYKDSIIYIFNANLIAKADQKFIYPIHFRLTLPPKLKLYKTFGIETFAFYYSSRQVVFVYTIRLFNY